MRTKLETYLDRRCLQASDPSAARFPDCLKYHCQKYVRRGSSYRGPSNSRGYRARTVQLCRSIRVRETGARERKIWAFCIYTRPGRGEMALIEIRGLQRQRVQQVGRQGRREGPGTAGAPGAATAPAAAASARVGRAAVAGAVRGVFHVHQALVGDRLDLVRRQHAVRTTGRRRRTPRRASLRLHGAGHGAGRAAVGSDATLRRGLLLGQSFLLAKLCTPILEPYLQHRHGWPTMLGPVLPSSCPSRLAM